MLADAYVTAAELDAYCDAYGWRRVVAPDAAINRATQYLDARYEWDGARVDPAQPLEWPRTIADGIPRRIKEACCELAIRAADGSLLADREARVVVAESVDVLSVKYAQGTADGQTVFAVVDALVRPYLTAQARGSKTVGMTSLVRG